MPLEGSGGKMMGGERGGWVCAVAGSGYQGKKGHRKFQRRVLCASKEL